jgi:hypothetical protein
LPLEKITQVSGGQADGSRHFAYGQTPLKILVY